MIRFALLGALLAGTAACGDDNTGVTDPTPARPTVTETFEGAVTVNGARTHPFAAGGSGRIDVTLTTLSPDAEARVGLALGTWNAGTGACQIVIANDNATQGALITGNAAAAGDFCARVFDVGQLTAPIEYLLTIVHF